VSSAIDSDCSVGLEFHSFLEDSEKCHIRIDGWHSDSGWCTTYISGLHRWKPEYRRRVYAKVQCLNGWYDEHHSPVSMVTFTTCQKGLPKPGQISLLKDSFAKAKKLLRKRIGYFPYVWVMECHESGYSHIHMLVFKDIPREVRQEIKKLWNEKYGAGGFSDAVQFEIRKGQRDLRSAAAYVFAYVTKTMDSEALSDVDSGYFKQSSWVWKMSQHDTPYKGVRTWDCSQDIKEAMRSPENASGVTWWRTSWNTADVSGWFPLWVDEDMAAYPERIHEFDSLLALGEVAEYSRVGCSDGYG
jgi:hypothetical protein